MLALTLALLLALSGVHAQGGAPGSLGQAQTALPIIICGSDDGEAGRGCKAGEGLASGKGGMEHRLVLLALRA